MEKYGKFPQIVRGRDTWNQDEFDELMREYRQGDTTLRASLITAHMGLVIDTSTKFRGRGLDDDDLIQEGSIGLMKCIDERYDPDKEGRNFTGYAITHIKQAIRTALNDKSRLIRKPAYQVGNSARIDSKSEDYQKNHGRKPTIEELSEITYIPVEGITELLTHSEPISLDITYQDGDEERGVRAVDGRALKHEDNLGVQDSLKRVLEKAALTPPERELLYDRYGLNGNPYRMTLKELGAKYGIRGESIRQRLIKIKRKLRVAHSRLTRKESAK